MEFGILIGEVMYSKVSKFNLKIDKALHTAKGIHKRCPRLGADRRLLSGQQSQRQCPCIKLRQEAKAVVRFCYFPDIFSLFLSAGVQGYGRVGLEFLFAFFAILVCRFGAVR